MLSQKLEEYFSSYRNMVVQRPPGARQTLSNNCVSPLQTSTREAAHREEDMQGFQMFSAIQRRNAQRNLVGTHAPISFKLLKEFKAACVQYGPMAPFTQMLWENMSLEALPPGDWKQLAKACLARRELSVVGYCVGRIMSDHNRAK